MICEGHEDLPSCKAVLEAIKFEEKPSCVEMDFWKWEFQKKICIQYIVQSKMTLAAHARHGVIGLVLFLFVFWEGTRSHVTLDTT